MKHYSLDDYCKEFLPAIEQQLSKALDLSHRQDLEIFYDMMAYHLGWEIPGHAAGKTGKRLRPLLLILTTVANDQNWRKALPAAAALELIHNFSLIHDDIQDNSSFRRGRPSVWKLWGIPQAINAGDAMFSLAFRSVLGLNKTCTQDIALQCSVILSETCLQITQGQYFDMRYENINSIDVDAYWNMIGLKTAALISSCTLIGSIIGGSNKYKQNCYYTFGREIGLAFQIVDDMLGIWGEVALTGKSTESDLVSGKKSLPIIYGIQQEADFANRWRKGQILSHEAQSIAQILEAEGAKTYCKEQIRIHTNLALDSLEKSQPEPSAGEALKSLALQLTGRNY